MEPPFLPPPPPPQPAATRASAHSTAMTVVSRTRSSIFSPPRRPKTLARIHNSASRLTIAKPVCEPESEQNRLLTRLRAGRLGAVSDGQDGASCELPQAGEATTCGR